jgi:phospholipase/carboxylesterase
MSISTESERVEIGDWVVRLRTPQGGGPYPVVVMLHGWTGNEDVTWIFAARLPAKALLIAPRGLHGAGGDGFSWTSDREQGWPTVDSFRPAVAALDDLLTLENFPEADLSQISLVGFSQGAALSYTYTLLHPERVKTVAGLAGFIPEDADQLAANKPLQGKKAFVTHGTEDNIVGIERARRSVEVLEQAGAQVTFCEDQVGHKLSLNCFKALQTFFHTFPEYA